MELFVLLAVTESEDNYQVTSLHSEKQSDSQLEQETVVVGPNPVGSLSSMLEDEEEHTTSLTTRGRIYYS